MSKNFQSVIVIAGLPRSGTTVLQKMIASDKAVYTEPETWLIPLTLGGIEKSSHSNVGLETSRIQSKRFQGFDRFLVESLVDYFRETAKRNACKVYLEKTPRNYFFIHQISQDPKALTIVLVRRPRRIIASFIKYFFNNSFRYLNGYVVDLVLGSRLMSEDFVIANNPPLVLKYENLDDLAWRETVKRKTGVIINGNLRSLPKGVGDSGYKSKLKEFSISEMDSDPTMVNTFSKKAFILTVEKLFFGNYGSRYGYDRSSWSDIQINNYSLKSELIDIFHLIIQLIIILIKSVGSFLMSFGRVSKFSIFNN